MTTPPPTHGPACLCDACMQRDERRWTVWHDDAPPQTPGTLDPTRRYALLQCATCGAGSLYTLPTAADASTGAPAITPAEYAATHALFRTFCARCRRTTHHEVRGVPPGAYAHLVGDGHACVHVSARAAASYHARDVSCP